MKKLAFSLVAVSMFAQAQVTSFLVKQWLSKGDRFCQYDNGTILNVGTKLCPLSIKP